MKFSLNRLGESYIDTLAKLYRYSTSVFVNNKQSAYAGAEGGYTYGEFKRTCDGLSKTLTCYGIGAGDGVAILAHSQPNWAIAFFCATAFGRVTIPILPDSSATEVSNILNHSEAKAIFVSKRCMPQLSQECIDKLVLVIDIDTLKVIKRDNESFT